MFQFTDITETALAPLGFSSVYCSIRAAYFSSKPACFRLSKSSSNSLRTGIFDKRHSNESNLKKLLSIPLETSEAFEFLAGRVPVHDYHSASLQKKTDSGDYILVLEKKCLKVVEKIYLDESKKKVRKVEMFDLRGSLLYRAELSRIQDNGYQIPSRLDIASRSDGGFRLDIEKYWTNISISPSTFVLTPPEDGMD